nr:unnamed protein product [Drosophila melanogaster]
MKRKTVKTPSFIKENAPKKMCSKETKGFLEEILEESEVEYLLQEENWKVKNKTIKPTEGNDAEDNDTDDENKEMDLSEQPKEKPRGKYLKKCPNVELLYNRPHRRKQDEILHNGGSMGPVWIGKQLLQFKNTCPFDSLVEILSTAYIDNFYYKSLLDDFYTDNLTIELVKKYAVEGVSSSLYCDRGLVLKSFFDEKHQIIKCDANIGSFIEKALNGVPSASSHRTHIKNNHDCRNQKYIHHRLEVIDVEKVGHLDVQEVVIPFIDEFFARTDGECKICGGQQILERQPGPHVILDIEFAMDAFHQIHHNGLPGTTTLLQVPGGNFNTGKEIYFKWCHRICSCDGRGNWTLHCILPQSHWILGSAQRYVQAMEKVLSSKYQNDTPHFDIHPEKLMFIFKPCLKV